MGVYGGPQREVSIQSASGRSLYSSGVVQDGLVLNLDANKFYSYPQSGITWTDISGGGNTGTLTNGPTYSSANGGSIVFDGTNDFINIPDSSLLTSTSALTINCWVRATAFSGGYSSIIGKGTSDLDEEYCVVMHSSFLYFDVGGGGPYTQPSYTFNTNTWYNICCVHLRTAGTSSLLCYVNGVSLNNSTTSPTSTPNDNSLPVSIGSRLHNSSNGPFNGNIAQVSIYNRALSAAEVSQNYNALRNRFFDSDAVTYLTAVEATDGQSLEPAVAIAINNFVVGCKSDGIWSAIKASCILAGARTLSGALIPLVGTAPTNFNFVSGDYNRKTGLVGNGSTKYLNSNRAGNADPQNNAHIAVYQSTSASSTSNVFMTHIGAVNTSFSGSQIAEGFPSSVNEKFVRFKTDGTLFEARLPKTSLTNANGLQASSRSLSASFTFRAGNINTSVTSASVAQGSENYFILGQNNSGTVTNHTNARLAFYSIGESVDLALLDTRVTTMINAFAATIP
jgi:hypothetical protein